jgi:hypothetical protein
MRESVVRGVKKWARRMLVLIAVLAVVGGPLWYVDSLTGHSRSLSAITVWATRFEDWKTRQTARPWEGGRKLDSERMSDVDEIFRTTNIWRVDLSFGREEWEALGPRNFGAMPNFQQPSGLMLTRNPAAPRNGVIGVLGYGFDWTHGDASIGGVRFADVAVRKKGNVAGLWEKSPFKIDLNKYQKGQKLGGRDEWTFNNLVWDQSRIREALAYEFFRDCEVASPRTAYAWLTVRVTNQWDARPFGLYVMIEPVDEEFARERFGSKKVPIFKPVTYSLFDYLGEDWSAYAGIYDLKTEASGEQKQRVIDFARLVTKGSDAEFAKQAATFLDVDEVARLRDSSPRMC